MPRNQKGENLVTLQITPLSFKVSPSKPPLFVWCPYPQIYLGFAYTIRPASDANCTGGDGTSVFLLGGIARTEVRSDALGTRARMKGYVATSSSTVRLCSASQFDSQTNIGRVFLWQQFAPSFLAFPR